MSVKEKKMAPYKSSSVFGGNSCKKYVIDWDAYQNNHLQGKKKKFEQESWCFWHFKKIIKKQMKGLDPNL